MQNLVNDLVALYESDLHKNRYQSNGEAKWLPTESLKIQKN